MNPLTTLLTLRFSFTQKRESLDVRKHFPTGRSVTDNVSETLQYLSRRLRRNFLPVDSFIKSVSFVELVSTPVLSHTDLVYLPYTLYFGLQIQCNFRSCLFEVGTGVESRNCVVFE